MSDPPNLLGMLEQRQRDRRGYYRSPVTLQSYRLGKPPANKGLKFPPEVPTPREVLALIDACGRGAIGRRNRAMIVVMWRAGLRCAEVLDLAPKDVDLHAGTVRVLHGKGNRARTVGLDPMACAIVADWLEERRKLDVDRRWLFCAVKGPTRGGPLYGAYLRNAVKEATVRAGIDKRLTPHSLRHAHASELAGELVDLRVISSQLGHSNSSVTAHYIDHLNPRRAVEVIRARPWPEVDLA